MTIISDDQIGRIYGDHMIDARERLREIERQMKISDHANTKGEMLFSAEYCYLQLRSIVELVSISILTAHNPFDEFCGSKLIGEYNPSILLKQLGKLHPAAFPHRGFKSEGPERERVFFATPLETFEARDRMSQIYTTACDKLHLGALKSVLKRGPPSFNFNDIHDDWEYLVQLLNEHIIVLPDKRIIYCKLDYPDGKGITLYWITLPPSSIES